MKKYLMAIIGIIFNVALLTGILVYAFALKGNEGYTEKQYIILHEEQQENTEQEDNKEIEEQEDSKKIDNNINNTTVKKDYQNNNYTNTNNNQNEKIEICYICGEGNLAYKNGLCYGHYIKQLQRDLEQAEEQGQY